jgi:hypothetical protein
MTPSNKLIQAQQEYEASIDLQEKGYHEDAKIRLDAAVSLALLSIAESLDKIAGCVKRGSDGHPTLSTTDAYQEWRRNMG